MGRLPSRGVITSGIKQELGAASNGFIILGDGPGLLWQRKASWGSFGTSRPKSMSKGGKRPEEQKEERPFG